MVAIVSYGWHLESEQRAEESWNESDGFLTYQYTRTRYVKTDVATNDSQLILQSSYVPQPFETDDDNPDARVIRRVPRRTKAPDFWLIEITYSTNAPTAQDGDTNGSPLGKPVEWESSFEPIQVVMDYDVNDDPVRLSNGLRPNPPLMVTRYMPVHRATVARLTYPSDWLNTKAGRVNSDNYLGCAAGTLMCRIPSVKPKYAASLKYYIVVVEFMYDPRGWQPRLLNAGYMAFTGVEVDGQKELRHIRDVRGEEVTEPWPLDEDGYALDPDEVQTGTGYTFKDVTAYESAAFASMGLGTP